MKTSWILKTQGEPLEAVRRFLTGLWHAADLDGLLVQLAPDGSKSFRPILVNDPMLLNRADPFIPAISVNGARIVAELVVEHPEGHYAAVLRSCEARALRKIVERERLDLTHWLILGVDCLACFPEEDFDWRLQNAGGVEKLTQQVMRNARQGGVSLYRFREACQMCLSPASQAVDVCIGLLGLPVRQMVLVMTRDEALADRLHLDRISDGPAAPDLIAQYELMIAAIDERRDRVFQRLVSELGPDLPCHVNELIAHLQGCAPCQSCLEACPIYADELAPRVNGTPPSPQAVLDWLASCVVCGMCQDACPKHLPLTAVFNRIGSEVKGASVAV